LASSGFNFTFDTVAPSMASTNPISVSAGTDGLYNPTDTLTFNFSEAVSVSALTIASLGVSGTGGSLGNSTLKPVGGATDFASSFTLTLGSTATLLAGNTFTVAAGALVDKASNASTVATTFTAPAVPSIDSIVAGYYPSTGTYQASPSPQVYNLTNSGQILVIVDVKPRNNPSGIGFEHWLLIDSTGVLAHKEFSQGVGPSLRFVEDFGGNIYFQTLNGDLTTSPPTQNTANAASLYKVTEANILAALQDTSDTLALSTTYVTKVADFSLAQLSSNHTVTTGQLGFVANIMPGTSINLTDGSNIVITGIHDGSTNSNTLYLNRFSSTGATVYSMALSPDNQLYMSNGNYSLFTRTGTATTGNAYHIDLLNGDQTEISLSLYSSIQNNSLPSNLGTNAGDTLVGISGADILYGFEGNDSITGGAGNDTIYGGAGNDSINGGLGSDLIVGGAGADVIDLGTDSVRDTVKFMATTDSTVTAYDIVSNFNATYDKIDVTNLLSAYTSTVYKTEASDLLVTGKVTDPITAGTASNVQVTFSYGGTTPVDYFSMNIAKTQPSVQSQATLLTQDSWSQTVLDGQGAVFIDTANRGIAQSAIADDPLTTDVNEGLLLQIKFTLAADVTQFDLSASNLELGFADGSSKQLTLPTIHFNTNGVVTSQITPTNNQLVIVKDSNSNLTSGDNELHWFQDLTNGGLLKIQYDTNAMVGQGQTSLSTMMEIHGITTALSLDNFIFTPII
jgi:Ca2+-binding RTX toxin-like protein